MRRSPIRRSSARRGGQSPGIYTAFSEGVRCVRINSCDTSFAVTYNAALIERASRTWNKFGRTPDRPTSNRCPFRRSISCYALRIRGAQFAPASMSSLADISELVGFFSYSREDDADSYGALSALRSRIQGELRGQLGRTAKTFRLWQDKEAIPSGTLWETEIKNAVGQSVFFIPIITPTVVASPYCRFELEAFLAREAELGRGDLVFPILYIDVPGLEDSDRRQNDPVLSIIAKRQYVDWRKLRHRDVRGTDVSEAVERFCTHIRDAVRRPWLSPEECKQREEAAAQQQAEAERQRQEAEAKRRVEGEARRRAAEEQRRQREAEAEQRRKDAAEAKRRAEEEAQRRREVEAERQAEAERRRVQEQRLREEAKAKRRVETEERSQKEQAAQDHRGVVYKAGAATREFLLRPSDRALRGLGFALIVQGIIQLSGLYGPSGFGTPVEYVAYYNQSPDRLFGIGMQLGVSGVTFVVGAINVLILAAGISIILRQHLVRLIALAVCASGIILCSAMVSAAVFLAFGYISTGSIFHYIWCLSVVAGLLLYPAAMISLWNWRYYVP
jgi:TIR domain